MGLRVGLLIGIAFALFKTVQSRRSSSTEPATEPWQPIVDTPRPRPAEAPAEQPVDEAPAEQPVDEVGEPIIEPVVEEPTIAPEPDPSTLRMPAIPDEPTAVTDAVAAVEPVTPEEVAAEQVEADVALVADDILEPAPVAKPEPLDVVPDDDKPIAPVKKAAKVAKKAAKKAAKAARKVTKKAAAPAALTPFVEPQGGVCPTTHPVKAKVASKLFHLPGMFAYDRTRPDRCYVDASAAEADGFVRARR